MSTIKSYAAKEAGADLSLWEYDAGDLKPEDVEVQVEYCGICHSDLSMIDNEWGMSSYPLVAGHEVIGRVAALGSAAQDKGLKVGQKVGIGWTARSCGHCDACISGNHVNCLEGSVPTIINRGGFADKLRADWQWVIPLPENVDLESAGPMLCGGITVFKPLLMHHVTAKPAASASSALAASAISPSSCCTRWARKSPPLALTRRKSRKYWQWAPITW